MFFPSLFLTGAPPRGRCASDFLMLAFKLSKNSRKPLSFFSPPFLSFAGAKVLHFPLPPTTIFIIFQYFYILSEYQRDKFHAFCNNCCRKAVFWRKLRFLRNFIGPAPAVFRAFPAEIRARFTAFMPFQGGSGRTRLGTFSEGTLLYICEGWFAWRMCLTDAPVGTLPRTPAAYMVTEVASSRRFGRHQVCRFCAP